MVDELKQETNSADVTLEGYISNTNLSNFDFDNTSTVVFDSFSTFRSGIYSTSIEIVTKSIKNPQYIRLAGGMLADSPLTAIGIAMSINDEGLVQATVTGLLTSGLTTAVGVLVIAPAITTAGLPTATAIGVGIVATGIIGLITDKLIDGVYDFAEKQISEYKYNENNKSLELNTNLDNINDIKTLVEPTILYGSAEKNEYIKNITVNQNVDNKTTTYSIKSGDTMFGIANRFGVSEDELIEANPWLADRYSDDKKFALIKPDEQLIIPEGSIKGIDNTKINQYFNQILNGTFNTPDKIAPETVTLPNSGKTENLNIQHYTSKPQMLSNQEILFLALKTKNIEKIAEYIKKVPQNQLINIIVAA